VKTFFFSFNVRSNLY